MTSVESANTSAPSALEVAFGPPKPAWDFVVKRPFRWAVCYSCFAGFAAHFAVHGQDNDDNMWMMLLSLLLPYALLAYSQRADIEKRLTLGVGAAPSVMAGITAVMVASAIAAFTASEALFALIAFLNVPGNASGLTSQDTSYIIRAVGFPILSIASIFGAFRGAKTVRAQSSNIVYFDGTRHNVLRLLSIISSNVFGTFMFIIGVGVVIMFVSFDYVNFSLERIKADGDNLDAKTYLAQHNFDDGSGTGWFNSDQFLIDATAFDSRYHIGTDKDEISIVMAQDFENKYVKPDGDEPKHGVYGTDEEFFKNIRQKIAEGKIDKEYQPVLAAMVGNNTLRGWRDWANGNTVIARSAGAMKLLNYMHVLLVDRNDGLKQDIQK